jgi:hypothetical protein
MWAKISILFDYLHSPSDARPESPFISATRSEYFVLLRKMAGPTRLELATSCVTGRRSNRLNYGPVVMIPDWWEESALQRTRLLTYTFPDSP